MLILAAEMHGATLVNTLDDDLAVDEHVGNSFRVLVRRLVRGRVLDAVVVEHDEIREAALREQPAPGQVERFHGLSHELGIPFYVAAPISTIDAHCPRGDDIPIEERSQDEVLYAYGLLVDGRLGRVRLAPAGAKARNPAFDVTPAGYLRSIITQNGIYEPENIIRAFRAD